VITAPDRALQDVCIATSSNPSWNRSSNSSPNLSECFFRNAFSRGSISGFQESIFPPSSLFFYQSIDRSIEYPPLIEHSSSFNSETKSWTLMANIASYLPPPFKKQIYFMALLLLHRPCWGLLLTLHYSSYLEKTPSCSVNDSTQSQNGNLTISERATFRPTTNRITTHTSSRWLCHCPYKNSSTSGDA